MKQPLDLIIVGQGIAGSVLALTFLEQGKKILVIDKDRPVTSSKVAAGLYNPITGRKPTLTWNAALFFPYMRKFYQRWQEILQVKFLHEMPVFRPAADVEALNDMSSLSAKEGISDFMELAHYPLFDRVLQGQSHGCSTKFSGYVDTESFLKAVRTYLRSNEILLENEFLVDQDLMIKEDEISWMGFAARYLVFCEGHRMQHNPFFNYLPLRPNKGQIEDIQTQELPKDIILNRGVFAVPIGNGFYRVGATYSWDLSHENPENSAKDDNEEKFNKLISIRYEHHRSRAAIRPATLDRKPLIGTHPKYSALGIFNGMGSKGVSMSPYLALHFYKHLMEGEGLMPETNISRFQSLQQR